MSHKKKISVVLLGKGDYLKKALITNIVGRDLSRLSRGKVLKNTEIYENDTFEFICTPDFDAEHDDIKELFILKQDPGMCLLAAEGECSPDELWQQVDKLRKISGKQADKFRVVLPVGCKQEGYHPSNVCTTEQLVSELRNAGSQRRPGHPESDSSTSHGLRTGKRSSTTVNLVLLGMAGTGKSASGNTILGKRQFTAKPDSKPVTSECQEAETEIDGTRVRVIDTPDIFDDEIKSSVRDKHVTKCKQLCGSDPCVYLLVMHVSRFTDGERDILKKLKKAFDSKVQEQTVILFTRGDDLRQGEMSFEDFLSSCQPDLRKLVEACGNRCVLFENRGTNPHQVEKLMRKVNMVLELQ